MGFEVSLIPLLMQNSSNGRNCCENDAKLLSDHETHLYSIYTSVLLPRVLPSVNIIGAILNLLCFCVYITSPRLRKVPSFHYLYLLAVVSVVYCSVQLHVHLQIGDNDQLFYSLVACKTVFYLQNVAIAASVFCIFWFTMARSCAILHPFLDVHSLPKVSVVRLSIFLIPLLYFSYIFVIYDLHEEDGICAISARYQRVHFTMQIVELVVLGLLPVLSITVLNLLLVIKLKRPDDAITFINSNKSSSSIHVVIILTLASFVAVSCAVPNTFCNAIYGLSNLWRQWYLRYGTIVVVSRYSSVVLNTAMAFQAPVFSLIVPEFRADCSRLLHLEDIGRCLCWICCGKRRQKVDRSAIFISSRLIGHDDWSSYYYSYSNSNSNQAL